MKLQFDFRNFTYSFHMPVQIIQTHDMDKVLSCLQAVENWTQKGFYAAGFISYEAASAFQSCLKTRCNEKLPLIWFGIFKEPCQRSAVESTAVADPEKIGWQSETSWEIYRNAIAAIHDHIAAGNSYQVNYALRMQADFPHDPYAFYLHLLKAQQSGYSAYLDCEEFQVLSASPELFFELDRQSIKTRPMKGTAPRGVTNLQDMQNQCFLESEKNQAENLMIVDLLRNDLGKIAKQGSVKVTSLFEKEKYPTVWQLTSEIRAELRDKVSLVDIFKALFPCGSVTGAPKVNTMRIITELEQKPRGVYCGALGMITPDQKAIFAVPIRTMVVHQQKAVYGVGGGITWDSSSHDEYDEVIHKAQVLYECRVPENLLESLLLENGEYFLLEPHLRRLKESAAYFDFPCSISRLAHDLRQLALSYPKGNWKVRLLLNQQGDTKITIEAVHPIHSGLNARWALLPIKRHNVFLYHKTTRRDFYPKAELNQEILLFNEAGEVTEFVNGNVVLRKGGKWITPPVSSGLLNGTMREFLLKQGKIHEAVIMKKDIVAGRRVAFINSVRKWRIVNWQEL